MGKISPEFWGRFALIRSVLWFALLGAGMVNSNVRNSIVVLFFISVVTAIVGEIAIWQAARAERAAGRV